MWAPELGLPNLGPKFEPTVRVPKFGPRMLGPRFVAQKPWAPNVGPKLGPKTLAQIWGPHLEPQTSCPKSEVPKFGVQIWGPKCCPSRKGPIYESFSLIQIL